MKNLNKIIVYSIPKTGTHLLAQIIALIININCNIYDKNTLYQYVPHLMNNNLINKINFFTTHPNYINYNIIEKANYIKLFVIRNPLDLVISHFYFYYYNRLQINNQRLVDKNLNKIMFNWCLKKINNISNKLIKHIYYQRKIKNSSLIDYNSLINNKAEHIKLIIDLIKVNRNQEYIDKIIEKIDIKKCREYEKKKKIFKVGSIQNNYFFRDGTNNQYNKYFTNKQINLLIDKIPKSLRELYNIVKF